MVSNGKHENTIAARYERLRAKADEQTREAGQWPPRKAPKSSLPITDHYERLQSKARLERLDPADRQFIAALLTPTRAAPARLTLVKGAMWAPLTPLF
jgi:hypothetical protein